MVEGFKKSFYTTSQKQERKPETTRPLITNLLLNTLTKFKTYKRKITDSQKNQKKQNKKSQIQFPSVKVQNKKRNHKETVDRSLLQSVNIRFEQFEMKLNQFAELTQNIFIQNVPLNDPMDVEPDVQTEKMLMKKKKNNACIVEKSDISQDTVEALKENKNLKEKIYEKT